MRKLLILLIALLAISGLNAQELDSTIFDDNTAFFEGEVYSYLIPPPSDFIMNSTEATDEGYSFAFIPKDDEYVGASIIIGINIYKIKEESKNITIDEILSADTSAVREHFGKGVVISEVEPIQTLTSDKMRTVYLNDDEHFLPNVMISYLNGQTEILIFELTITEDTPKFIAEKKYLECLNKIKVLTKGEIEVG